MINEDKLPAQNLPAAQISLTDCLACSGCVTSAEAVLISLQSHAEVLNALNGFRSIGLEQLYGEGRHGATSGAAEEGRIFVASVSPQTRASLATAYGVSEPVAGNMIEQMLSGPHGIRRGTKYGSDFLWVVDTNTAREACLVLGAGEMMQSLSGSEVREGNTTTRDDGAATRKPDRPILTSTCPGWICYAEKTHPHVLPHLSRLKSPQALLGTLIKTSLASSLGISPERIWHLAIMPCFDKKLEASREELTDAYWKDGEHGDNEHQPRRKIRDVDCVITTKELLMLADSAGITFSDLPRDPLPQAVHTPFADPVLDQFLFPSRQPYHHHRIIKSIERAGGSSGGYLYHILQTFSAKHPGSEIHTTRGRNSDIVEHAVMADGKILLKTARYYGFRNIQNLVRKLKPAAGNRASRMPGAMMMASRKVNTAAKLDYAYVEVMACPGGCTNGGGQIKAAEAASIGRSDQMSTDQDVGMTTPAQQKAWLNQVDEAYFSSSSSSEDTPPQQPQPPPLSSSSEQDQNDTYIHDILKHWSSITHIPIEKLVYTSYGDVVGSQQEPQDDDGNGNTNTKGREREMARVVELAGMIGGGW